MGLSANTDADTGMELLALLPWDDPRRGIASDLQDWPAFAWVDPRRLRKVRAPVRVRVDAANGLHLLGTARELVHLGSDGEIAGRTPLSPEPERRIVDYACEASGRCIVLEKIGGAGQQVNRLRRVGGSEDGAWSRTGPSSTTPPDFAALFGDFSQVLLDETNRRLYLQAKHEPAIAELDAETGAVVGTLALPEGGGRAFLAGGRLGCVVLNPAGNLRGIWRFDLERREAVEHPGTAEHFAWLVYPFGMDEASRIYAWREGRIARISFEGTLEEIFAISGVAVRAADKAVFTSRAVNGAVRIAGTGIGTDVELELAAPPDFRLIAIDAKGRYHLLGPETPAADARRLVFSADLRLETDAPMPELPTIECRLPTYDLWQVDRSGRVIFPVTTPEGLAVLRLTPR